MSLVTITEPGTGDPETDDELRGVTATLLCVDPCHSPTPYLIERTVTTYVPRHGLTPRPTIVGGDVDVVERWWVADVWRITP